MHQWFDCHLPGAMVSQVFPGRAPRTALAFPTTRQSASKKQKLLSLTTISYKYIGVLACWDNDGLIRNISLQVFRLLNSVLVASFAGIFQAQS